MFLSSVVSLLILPHWGAHIAKRSATQEQQEKMLTALTIIRYFPACGTLVCWLLIHPFYRNQSRKSNTTKRSKEKSWSCVCMCVCSHLLNFSPEPLPHIFTCIPMGSGCKVFRMQPILKSVAAGILFIRPQCFEKYKSLWKFNLPQKLWVISFW